MKRSGNGKAKTLRLISFPLVVLLLSACVAAPTREDAAAFKLLQEGRVPPQSTQAFTDCLVDGFVRAHWVITKADVRQQRRSDLSRVEALTHDILLVSADVFDDGRVRLFESTSAALINTTGERDTFAKCLNLHGTALRLQGE